MPRRMLAGSPVEVAPRLLGARLVSGEIVARIVEVEAYDGADDPASHAYRGPTDRNAVMFGPAGHLYVYFTYGMHFCMNVVCGPDGQAAAVLLRAASIESGLDLARERRPGIKDRDLARGPGRLCKVLGVDRGFDGIDVCDRASPLWLATGPAVATQVIASGPRVGITRAADRPWRFWIAGEPTVSTFKPGRARRSGAGAAGR